MSVAPPDVDVETIPQLSHVSRHESIGRRRSRARIAGQTVGDESKTEVREQNREGLPAAASMLATPMSVL